MIIPQQNIIMFIQLKPTKYLGLICLLLFVTEVAFSQEYTLSGKVINKQGMAIPLANVLLTRVSDSSLVTGSSTGDSGNFAIPKIEKGEYFIYASYIGSKSKNHFISIERDYDIGSLYLVDLTQELEEVEITYQQPTLVRKADRTIFNISNTSLSEGDVMDALKRTPGVIVLKDRLTIKGDSDISILINDKKVNLPKDDIINLLSGTTAANVEAIEVITNPPAKYSAEGGMLINIKMSKNLISGYHGSVFNRYSQGVFPKHSIGIDNFFKGKKTDFSLNYNYTNSKRLIRYTSNTNFIENEIISSKWNSEKDNIRHRKRHSVSFFFDYELNKNNTLSLSSINTITPNYERTYDANTLVLDPDGSLNSSFNTFNDSNDSQLNSSVYLDFEHKMKERGAKLNLNSHYTFYDNEQKQNINTDFFNVNHALINNNNFGTNSTQRIDLYSVQLDYSIDPDKNSQFETGVRYAKINSESAIEQEGFGGNQPGIDSTAVGSFIYNEDIFAAYASYDREWNKWNLKTGLRWEYTKTHGKLDTQSTANERKYPEWFPSVSLMFEPSDKHAYNLFGYRRITRPRYNDINPFQYFLGNNSVAEGNPDLLPAYKNFVGFNYTYDDSFTFELYYRYHKNYLSTVTFQDNDTKLTRYISSNLDRELSYGLDFSMQKKPTDFWYCYMLSSYFYSANQFLDIGSNSLIDNGLWTLFFRTNNSFTFLKDKSLVVDVTFDYLSPITMQNTIQKSYNFLGLSVKKSIFNKQGSISIGVTDIFKQGNLYTTRRYLNQDNTSVYRSETRQFKFSFRYKFGNVKIKNNKKSKSSKERRRL